MNKEVCKSIVLVRRELIQGRTESYYKFTSKFYSKFKPKIIKDVKVLFCGILVNKEEIKSYYKSNISNTEELIGFLFHKHGSKILKELQGTFSLVIGHNNRVILLRDYFGISSLYYYMEGKRCTIVSNSIAEIKKILRLSINKTFLVHYFLYEDQTSWHTIYENIFSVPLFEKIELNDECENIEFSYTITSPFSYNEESEIESTQIISKIEYLIKKNTYQLVNGHENNSIINMMSGGVDSSYISVVLKEKGYTNSVSASFKDIGGDFKYALDVAKSLNLTHKNFTIDTNIFYDGIVNSIKKSEQPFVYKGESFFYTIFNNLHLDASPLIFLNGTGADALFSYGREMKLLRLIDLFSNNLSVLNEFFIKKYNSNIYNTLKLLIRDTNENYISQDLLKEYLGITEFKEKKVKEIFGLDEIPSLFDQQLKVINKYPTNLSDKIFRIHAYYGMSRIPNMTSMLANEKNSIVVYPFLNRNLFELMQSVPLSKKKVFKTKKYFLKKLLEKELPREFVYRKKIMMDVPFENIFNSNKNFKKLIQEIKDSKYEYFNINYNEVFNSSIYTGFALKLINFHIINTQIIK